MLIVTLLSAAGFALAAIPRLSAFVGSESFSEPQVLTAFGGALFLLARLSRWDGVRWRERVTQALGERTHSQARAAAVTPLAAE